MNFEAMEGERRHTADAILSKVGAAIETAEQSAAAKTSDRSMRKLMAARMALEYAVLATAREKSMATEAVADALKGASVAQQAAMIQQGRAALGRAYRVEPDVLVNVFAGQMMDLKMPKGLASNPGVDEMVDACRNLVTSIVKDEHANHGRYQTGSAGSDSFIALTSEGGVSPAKTELAARLAFMESTIDASVARGAMSKLDADALKQRIEGQVFQPAPPQSLQLSKAFTAFFELRGKGMRIEAMREVRGITQSQTVREIAARLERVMPAPGEVKRPSDHREHKPRER